MKGKKSEEKNRDVDESGLVLCQDQAQSQVKRDNIDKTTS